MGISMRKACAVALAVVLSLGMLGMAPSAGLADEVGDAESWDATVVEAAGSVVSEETAAAGTGSAAAEDPVAVGDEGSSAFGEAASIEPLWSFPTVEIAGTKVTDANKADIFGNGTCSLRRDESANRWILALNNASISATGDTYGILLGAADTDFAIELTGANSIATASGNGILVRGADLSISGAGTLSVESTDAVAVNAVAMYDPSSKVSSRGNFTCTGVSSLSLKGKGMALDCGGAMSLQGSSVRAVCSGGKQTDYAVQVSRACTIDASSLNAQASGVGVGALQGGLQDKSGVSIVNDSVVSLEADYTGLYAGGYLDIDGSTLSSESRNSSNGGVFSDGTISVSGSRSVVDARGQSEGIHAIGSIVFSGGRIEARTTGYNAVYAGDAVTVSGTDTFVSATGGMGGIVAVNSIAFSGGSIEVFVNGGSYSYGVSVAKGPLTVNGAKLTSWAKNPSGPESSTALIGMPITVVGKASILEGIDAATAQSVDRLTTASSGGGTHTSAPYVSIATSSEPVPDPAPQVKRLAGADRYQTMTEVSKTAFPNTGLCPTVILARGDNFPDALAAAGLAGVTGGQVLLTETGQLTKATSNEIKRLGAKKAYVIGDRYSVSDKAFSSIKSLVGGNAERLGGASREETAIKIYGAGKSAGGWGTTAIVATGQKAPDSLSVSPIAYALKAPIFLTDKNGALPKAALDAIKAGGFTKVIVLGDEHSVSNSAFSKVKALVSDTVRMGGTNRYATSKLTAEWALKNGFTCKSPAFTAGRNGKFADALVASSLGGRSKSVLLLVDDGGTGLACVDGVLAPNKGQAETVYVLGDKYTVSDAMYRSIEKAIR